MEGTTRSPEDAMLVTQWFSPARNLAWVAACFGSLGG